MHGPGTNCRISEQQPNSESFVKRLAFLRGHFLLQLVLKILLEAYLFDIENQCLLLAGSHHWPIGMITLTVIGVTSLGKIGPSQCHLFRESYFFIGWMILSKGAKYKGYLSRMTYLNYIII